MSAETQVRRLLDAHDFALVRQRKHNVYRNPAGITFVRPHTGSDSRRGDRNSLADLKRVLRGHGLPITTPASEIRASKSVRKPDVTPEASRLSTAVDNSGPVATPAPPPSPAPLTKAEQKKLARWERNYAAKERKREEFYGQLNTLLAGCRDLVEFGASDCAIAWGFSEALRRTGYQTRLMLARTEITVTGEPPKVEGIHLIEVNQHIVEPVHSGVTWEPGQNYRGPHRFQNATVRFCEVRTL